MSRNESASVGQLVSASDVIAPRYKWIALAVVTFGSLLVSISQSIVLIALPDIFRGIHLNPLTPANSGYLLWMLMGFPMVVAVLMVTLGRVGDIYGRVRIFNLGFAVFTVFSMLLTITWFSGSSGALWMVGMRFGQGIGGAMLFANSYAIITDAFPENRRGLAISINSVTWNSGAFIGLLLGGVLAPVQWRLVFFLSVPLGLLGTIWGYASLKHQSIRTPERIDWIGNLSFAIGLISILIGITYGMLPYGHHSMGWTNPLVLIEIFGGFLVLFLFAIIETKVAHPMFRLNLFRIRAFSAGNIAGFFAGLSRGGFMFILIIWLQGIWLPEHGYSFSQTPLWAGIYMVPLTIGFLIAGPICGMFADRHGARLLASGGLLVSAASFVLLLLLPVNFSYWVFAALIFLSAIGMGMFVAPNVTVIMNCLPASQRGAGGGMTTTFSWAGQVLSTGVFFTLLILGLASKLSSSLYHGLTGQGLSHAIALHVSHLSPASSLFAAFLGYNPMKTLLGPHILSRLSPTTANYVTSRGFFPRLISAPFNRGLIGAFSFAAAVCVLGAVVSLLRGGKFRFQESGFSVYVDSPLAVSVTGMLDVAADHEGQATTVPSAYSGTETVTDQNIPET